MVWQPIDYQGILKMNRALVDQINHYLDQKETHLANSILSTFHISGSDRPILAPPKNASDRLSLVEALDLFQKKIGEKKLLIAGKPRFSPPDWSSALHEINEALWEYVEILEGSVVELYQQVAQIGCQEWTSNLTWVVDAIKDELRRRIDVVMLSIHRIENILWQYRCTSLESNFWLKILRKWFGAWGLLLDKSLTMHLENSRVFLLEEHQKFMSRYNGYQALKAKTDDSLRKFEDYETFLGLDKTPQDKFKELYQLLGIWELNQYEKAMPVQDVITSIHSLLTVDGVMEIFRYYAKALDEFLFRTSRMIKLGFKGEVHEPEPFLQEMENQRAELHTLGATVEKYRRFILLTNPNPYIRGRLGFTETTVGPEPVISKEFQDLGFTLESLDKLFQQLLSEYKEAIIPKESDPFLIIQNSVNPLLHEMSQPLVAYKHITRLAHRLTDYLEKSHELGTNNLVVVDFMSDALTKAMLADWRFQALQEIDKFHHVYDLHKRISGLHGNGPHIKRMNKFRHHFQQIEKWVKQGTTFVHAHEIETEINDIKIYLQDFLAYLQRIAKDKDINPLRTSRLINQVRFELLEYLYLFDGFFWHLGRYGFEGKAMRRKFLFADQYFEYLFSKNNELREDRDVKEDKDDKDAEDARDTQEEQ